MNYQRWMRSEFPLLNQSLDDELSSNALFQFIESILPLHNAIVADREIEARERFTYITMIHSATYHHQRHAQNSGVEIPTTYTALLRVLETTMTEMAEHLGVERRFLTPFYLFYNPEIPDLNGAFAQFRPSAYETAFIRINREGTLQYKLAAHALTEAFQLLANPGAEMSVINSLLETAARHFQKLAHGNAMLLKTPGGEEFSYLTQYFGETRIADGPPLRGVSAGDQPWSYLIDLLLGVNLRNVFVRSFEGTALERTYYAETHSNADVIRHEFSTGTYLHANYLLPEDYAALVFVMDALKGSHEDLLTVITDSFHGVEQETLGATLHAVMKHYIAASNVHYQLARRYVPKNTDGEQVGSAGTNIIKFLKEGLNAEREFVKRDLESRYPQLFEHHQHERTIP